MGTPRARKKSRPVAPVVVQKTSSSRTSRRAPDRPDSLLHGTEFKALDLPVRPDTSVPVRPISVRHDAQIGPKSL